MARNKQTRTEVTVIDNRDGLFDEDSEHCPWITLCEDHGEYCGHLTSKVARSFAAAPAEWCYYCEQIVVSFPDKHNRTEG